MALPIIGPDTRHRVPAQSKALPINMRIEIPMTNEIASAAASDVTGAERRPRRLFVLTSIFSSAVAASLLTLKFAPSPFFWLWLAWAAAFLMAIPGVQGSWPRAILFNFAIVAILLASIEAYFVCNDVYLAPTVSDGFYVPDDALDGARRRTKSTA